MLLSDWTVFLATDDGLLVGTLADDVIADFGKENPLNVEIGFKDSKILEVRFAVDGKFELVVCKDKGAGEVGGNEKEKAGVVFCVAAVVAVTEIIVADVVIVLVGKVNMEDGTTAELLSDVETELKFVTDGSIGCETEADVVTAIVEVIVGSFKNDTWAVEAVEKENETDVTAVANTVLALVTDMDEEDMLDVEVKPKLMLPGRLTIEVTAIDVGITA